MHFSSKILSMKKIIITLLFALVGITLNAQIFINGKPLDELFAGKFLEIDSRKVIGEREFNILVNYGQEVWGKRNMDMLTDEKGIALTFNNIVGALNYLDEKGWAYEDFIPWGGDTMGGVYLVERKE